MKVIVLIVQAMGSLESALPVLDVLFFFFQASLFLLINKEVKPTKLSTVNLTQIFTHPEKKKHQQSSGEIAVVQEGSEHAHASLSHS